MIKATDLKPTDHPGYRFRAEDAAILSLGGIRNTLLSKNEETYGLPIKIETNQIKSGGLLKSTIEDCLIITNTEHPTDYFGYCLTLSKQGKMAIVKLQYYGSSVLTGKANQTKEREQKGTLTGMLANAVFGVDQAAYNKEYEYYDALESLFAEIFGG